MNTGDIQRAFSRYILEQSDSEPLSNTFNQYDDDELEARLSIYKNNYFKSLTDVLCEGFPTIQKLLGEECFRAICKEYLKQHPPSQPNLTHFGEHLPSFLHSVEYLNEYPYLQDCARLDWYQHQSLNASNHTRIAPEKFANIELNILINAKIIFAKSLIFIESPYAVFSIWELNHATECLTDTLDYTTPEQGILIRHKHKVSLQKLDHDFYVFLKHLKNKLTLEQSIRNTLEDYPVFDASTAIAFLIQSHAVEAIALSNGDKNETN